MQQVVALMTSRACDIVGILGLPSRPPPLFVHRQACVSAEGARARRGRMCMRASVVHALRALSF